MPASVIGLDIGGANLKAAHCDRLALSHPFPLWKQPEALALALENLVKQLPHADHIAATMTGELCDCFPNKEEGVKHILASLKAAFPEKPMLLWRSDAQLIPIESAEKNLRSLAAVNWLALASFASRLAPNGPAILLDMGSTTTDIIPMMDGKPQPRGITDLERIRNGELVYLGASRTPLCAVLGPPYAAEWFACTQDIYLLLGQTPERPDDRGTADGRPATRADAHARVARMLCADAEDLPDAATREIAIQADRVLRRSVGAALKKCAEGLPASPETLILSGSGEFLLEQVVAETFTPLPRALSFRAKFGDALSSSACAFSLAILTQEHLSNASPG